LIFASLLRQGEASSLEGSTHPWVKLSFEVRNELLFIGEETWDSGEPPPLSRGATCLPMHCSVQGKVLEVQIRRKLHPRALNRGWTVVWVIELDELGVEPEQ
jgi:hypothetical protein